MLKFFNVKKTQQSHTVTDIKAFLNEELFKSDKQTKLVNKAARESALEQQQLVERYQRSIKHS